MADPTQTLIGNIYVDAVVRFRPSEPSSVTQHPIEDGTLIAEHVSDLPKIIMLDCVFTDDDFIPGAGVVGSAGLTTTADDKREAIEALKKERRLVTIENPRIHAPNRLLIDIQEDVTVQNASAYTPTLVFEHIQTATPDKTTVPLDKIKKKATAKKEAGMDSKATQDQGNVGSIETDNVGGKSAALALAELGGLV